ncbi:MAG: hypothetical protein AAFX65_03365 [Cyanobacteria bacterium J06638_7]
MSPPSMPPDPGPPPEAGPPLEAAPPPASPPERPGAVLVRAVLGLWALALALSAALAAAAQRWPAALPPDGRLVWALVLGPPLLMALWLAAAWRLEPHPQPADRGQSGDRAQGLR